MQYLHILYFNSDRIEGKRSRSPPRGATRGMVEEGPVQHRQEILGLRRFQAVVLFLDNSCVGVVKTE